jgi:hypothetical protein
MNMAHGGYGEQVALEGIHRRTPGIVLDACQCISAKPIRSIASWRCYAPQLPPGWRTLQRATAAYRTIQAPGAGAQESPRATVGGLSGCPKARVGWLDSQDFFLDADSAYRAANAMATDGDGIAVGVQTLVRRLHETSRLKSIDEQRCKLKVHRMIEGKRLEVLHLRADALESVMEKNRPNRPIDGREGMTCSVLATWAASPW